MPAMHVRANTRETAASSRIDSSRLRAITGSITLSSKLPAAPPKATAASLPMTCADDLAHRLGDDRVDLARHDRAARLQVGDADLAETGARPAAHPTQVVGDLHERHRDRAQHARRLDERVARALRLEVVARFGERQLELRRRAA